MDSNYFTDGQPSEGLQHIPIERIVRTTALTKRTLECIEKELNTKKSDPYEYKLDEEVNYRLFINNLIEKCMDQIHLGIEEADILLNLAEYIVILTLQKSRFLTKVNYLQKENDWLKKEMTQDKQHCLNLDEDVALNELLIQHYSKLHQMRTNQAVLVEKVIIVDNDKIDLGLDIPRHMKGIFKLIIDYISQGRYEVALSLINHSIQEIREQRKTQSYDYAIMLHIHAILLRDMGCLKEATTSLEETLRVLQNQPVKNNEHIVTTLNNLSVLHGRRGNFKAAEPLCRKALQIRLDELGENHPDVGKQLNNLALILQNIKITPEIERLYMRAIDIYDKSLEKCLIHKVKTKNNLVCFYIKSKEFSKAEMCLKEAITELHANTQVLGSSKRCLWEIIEDAVETNMSPAHFVKLFPKVGTFPDSSYKNTYRYLVTVYRRTQRFREADMIEIYLDWCTKINSTLADVKTNSLGEIEGNDGHIPLLPQTPVLTPTIGHGKTTPLQTRSPSARRVSSKIDAKAKADAEAIREQRAKDKGSNKSRESEKARSFGSMLSKGFSRMFKK